MAVQRLRSPSEFRVVYREGRRLPGDAVILYVRPNGLSVSRAGVTTPRGVGSAVRRNRWRRRLREALRAAQRGVRGGFDLVLVPRPTTVEVPFTTLSKTVRGLLEQAGVAPAGAEES
ncbi:MAG TPA: ribonuclease P protein component [bacterium]|nr:ribonuclease P protein component [bacterium]